MSELISKIWDSAFFGFEVGALSIDNNISDDVLNSLLIKAKKKFRLFYMITSSKENARLGVFEKDCAYIDERIIYEKKIADLIQNTNDSIEEYTKVSDGTSLYDLAFESGKYSRFKLDTGIGEEKFKRLYRLMIDNALKNEYADKVYIKKSDKIEGFVTVKKKENHLNIGLIGVVPEFQGTGVGSLLMKKVESYAIETGVKKIDVLTQKQNRVARKFYEKQGFHEAYQEQIYHLWF